MKDLAGVTTLQPLFGSRQVRIVIPKVVRHLRLGAGLLLLGVVCVPICVLTFLVGVPLALALGLGDWWFQARPDEGCLQR